MQVVVRPSVPALAPFVSSIGYLEGRFAHARERALPTGGAQLLVNLDADVFHSSGLDGSAQRTHGAAVQGASSRPAVIDPAEQRSVLWVAFRAGGGYPFFRAPSDELVGLDEFWGRDGAVLRERLLAAPTPLARIRLLERVLVERAARPLEPDPAVRFAAAALCRAIDFYVDVFDAKETERYTNDDGRIVHASLLIGGARAAVKDEGDGDPAPTSLGGSPVIMALEVDDADAIGARMEQAGATVVYPITAWAEGMYGGRLADPFGHLWMIDQR